MLLSASSTGRPARWCSYNLGTRLTALWQMLYARRAKWEERDTRWIVEERADGANVNAWHWQETSRLAWSRQRLADLLTGLAAELDPSLGHARVTGVKDLTGEARTA